MSSTEDKTEIIIRGMKEDDIDGVLAIDRNITDSNRVIGYASSEDDDVGGELGMSIVAEVGGEIAGFLLAQMTDSFYEQGNAAWMKLIGVDPRYQRQGIATKLVEGFVDLCRQKGIRSIRVMVRWHNWQQLSFLRSLGFDRSEMAELVKHVI